MSAQSRILGFILAMGLAAGLRVSAQPVAPDPGKLDRLRKEMETRALHPEATTAAPVPLSVQITDRAQSRAFFNAVYTPSEGVPSGWTGTLSGTPGTSATGTPGTTTAGFKAAVQLRINWFRAMAGIPASIAIDDGYSSMDQQAALMMSANNALDHTPPSSWLLYTSDGATAAGNSNLALGSDGPDAIDGYITDYGSNNTALGHRRWILYPQTQTMGTGDVDSTGSFYAANATWVLDGNYGTARPATRDGFVAWPPPGYVPYQVVFPRWSFSYPGADFSSATVTMTSNGASVPVSLEALDNNPGYGENTIAWVYNGIDADTAAPKPGADLAYNVAVNGVVVAGQAQNYSYAVTLFDPAVAGAGEAPISLTGPSQPVVGRSATYTVGGIPPYANGFQYRTVAIGGAPITFGAEGGLQGVAANTSAGYNPVDTGSPIDGTASYHLAMPSPVDQTLTLPGEYAASGSASLQFKSRLGYATSSQVARVQISLDDGVSWNDLYTQAGSDSGGETSSTARTVPLSAYSGYVFEIRFAYTYNPPSGGGSTYNETDSDVGWTVDDITFSSVSTAAPGAASAFSTGSTFGFTPAAAGAVALEARSVLLGAYPLTWGQLLNVTATAATSGPTSRLVNISCRAQVGTGGNILIVGFVVGGAGTSGTEPLLVRGSGPALVPFGVAGTLPDPQLQLYSGSTILGTNNGWGGNAQIASTASSVGAFPWNSATSHDSALLQSLSGGAYTAQIAGQSGDTGVALAELYDATPAGAYTSSTPRLVNISARVQVGTGGSVLIAGFVIGGSTSEKVLIRASGPALIPFGVTGTLADPKLQLFSGTILLGSNSGWGGAASISSAASSVGAFPWTNPSSNDSAILVTLPPGAYTAQVSGASGDSGVALVEVYEVP